MYVCEEKISVRKNPEFILYNIDCVAHVCVDFRIIRISSRFTRHKKGTEDKVISYTYGSP